MVVAAVAAAAAAAVIQLTVPENVLGIARASAGRGSRFLAMMGTHRRISAQLMR